MEADEAFARALAAELDERPQVAESSTQAAKAAAKATLRVNGKTAQLTDPKEDLKPALDLLHGKLTCGDCGAAVQRPPAKVTFNNTVDSRSAIMRLCHTTCKSCYTVICSGCGEASDCPSDCESEHSHGCETAQHCNSVRVVLLFEALSALDRLYIDLKTPLSSAPPSKKARASGSGVGYGHGYGALVKPMPEYEPDPDMDSDVAGSVGEGYTPTPTATAGTFKGKQAAPSASPSHLRSLALKVDSKIDSLFLTALLVVGHLVPRPEDDDAEAYDYVPDPAMRPLIQLSTLPETLSELLRNDNIDSISERAKLYRAVIKLLGDLASSSPTMTPILTEPRRVKVSTDGLGAYVAGSGSIEWERENGRGRGDDMVTVDSLYKQLAKLAKHGRYYVRIAEDRDKASSAPGANNATLDPMLPLLIPLDPEAEKAAKEALELAKHLDAVFTSVQESAGPLTSALSPDDGRSRSPAFEQQTYDNMCERLAFEIAEIVNPTARALATGQMSQMSPANAIHLSKELATLATNLPSGVFLRVDESSRNEMRALISGPDDTPYAYGLYEFSIKLPWDYPARPPTVRILTTAGGRVRFNPNLYADGKVCLSLLGTWQGSPAEMWQAWKSTLFQVLLSIQSIIMNEEPYHNEPGMAGGSREIADYNKNVALQSVRWAMVDWMDSVHLSGVWADVITEHFTLRRASIRAKIAKWAADDARMTGWDVRTMQCCGSQPPTLGGGNGSGAMNLVEEFEKRCDKLVPTAAT